MKEDYKGYELFVENNTNQEGDSYSLYRIYDATGQCFLAGITDPETDHKHVFQSLREKIDKKENQQVL